MAESIECSFPAEGEFISTARSTCRALREASGVKISDEAIDKLLTTTLDETTFNRLKSQHGVSSFPLRFPVLVSEMNFLSLLSLLNTLSGYRVPLHQATGDGAYQNVVKILLGLFITGGEEDTFLSAQGLKDLNQDDVAGILGVSLFTEKPHESLPGVTIGTRDGGGEVGEAIRLLVKACNETGTILVEKGYKNLGEFVVEILDEAEALVQEKGDLAGADHFVSRLVETIPGFADQATINIVDPSQPVYLYKKAFFLLFALYQRLDPRSPALQKRLSSEAAAATSTRSVPQPDVLPMFVDNVLCTMLVHLQVLDLSECTIPALQAWSTQAAELRGKMESSNAEEVEQIPRHVEGPRFTAQEAYVVRASALDAGQAIKNRAHQLGQSGQAGLGWMADINEADIDGYLWSVAKDDPNLRKVPRLVERNTIMY